MLERNEKNVMVHDAATNDDISLIKDLIKVLDGDVDLDKLSGLAHSSPLCEFMTKHCRIRHYTFQILKCTDADCTYCTALCPPRLPEEVFRSLNFLPDPCVDMNKEYKTFDQLYSTSTTDQGRPSVISRMQAKKIRGTVICAECGKRRVVYSAKRLTREEELVYTCGGTLFPTGPYTDTLVVRTGVNCASLIETQYYAGSFQHICIHCGDTEVVDTTRPQIKQMEQEWGIVRPIFAACMSKGKNIVTRNALKTGKKSKKINNKKCYNLIVCIVSVGELSTST
ncbi:uncharacterized protein LOC121388971 isoform X2 [Gigantopelta aegis]|uniref:uncharacterized protein LOC121388971 isoform X2 n=1 Tax=Gigantopelta aegis TaxID=1735272 RepID=UPI001B88DF0F|nr:uncharacterized protein LOC121388971 isoform X2 [Gigantopelta aegis]